MFLARSRETLKTASALDNGQTFTFDSEAGRFAPAVAERFNLTEGRRQRWFLYLGFVRDDIFGPGAPRFQGEAELLVPILNPRDASVLMDLQSEQANEAQVTVQVAGLTVGSVRVNSRSGTLLIPRDALFRGDNILHLSGPPGVEVRLVRLEVSLAPQRPPDFR